MHAQNLAVLSPIACRTAQTNSINPPLRRSQLKIPPDSVCTFNAVYSDALLAPHRLMITANIRVRLVFADICRSESAQRSVFELGGASMIDLLPRRLSVCERMCVCVCDDDCIDDRVSSMWRTSSVRNAHADATIECICTGNVIIKCLLPPPRL